MNMGEWMMQNPRPDRPQFDIAALQGLRGDPAAIQSFIGDWRNQIGDWRNQMADWRGDRRDYMQTMRGNALNPGAGAVPQPVPPPQMPVPGSAYGANLGQMLQPGYGGVGGGGYAIQNFADRQRFPQRY